MREQAMKAIEQGLVETIEVDESCCETIPCWHYVNLHLKGGEKLNIGEFEASSILDFIKQVKNHGVSDYMISHLKENYDCGMDLF